MNAHFRLSIAVLVSFLAHVIVLVWVMQQVSVQSPNVRGPMQVFLPQHINEPGRRPIAQPAKAASLFFGTAEAGRPQKPRGVAGSDGSVVAGRPATGHFRWELPPAHEQNEIMSAMRQAQIAQQSESHKAAILAGMSNLAVQLRPVVNTKIDCARQEDHQIGCTPEPEQKLRPLLQQFFNLALEARRLGIAGNPVHMDFGLGAGVSVNFPQ